MGKIVSRRLRLKILVRDNYICAYCKNKFEYRDLHIDHIFPKSKGGTSRPDNLITSCVKCNLIKSDKVLENPPMAKELVLVKGDLIECQENFPVRTIRISDEVWAEVNDLKKELKMSWGKFILFAIDKFEDFKKL